MVRRETCFATTLQQYTLGHSVTTQCGFSGPTVFFVLFRLCSGIATDPKAFMVCGRFSTAELHPELSVCFLS